MTRSGPSFNKKRSAAAIYLYLQDEDASEKVDLDEIWGVEY